MFSPGGYSIEDDDILLRFGVPPDAFAVRPSIQRVVAEAGDLRQRDARARAMPVITPFLLIHIV